MLSHAPSVHGSPIQGVPCFSFRNRLERFVFAAVWFAMAFWTPPPLRRWRIFLLRCFGARVHTTANVYGTCRIWLPRNLVMEERSCLGPRVRCYCMHTVTLGHHAVVSQDATLCAGTHDPDDIGFALITKPIAIESHAWVAAEAFVGPGVLVGANAILGARSVAFKDLEPDGIYAGNPARQIRKRSLTSSPSAP